MRNYLHRGMVGVVQPTRLVVASTSSTPSLGRGLEEIGDHLVVVEVIIAHMH